MNKIPLILAILLSGSVLFSCGSKSHDQLATAGLLEYLPTQTDALVLLPSHEQAARHLFTIFVHFFGDEALRELKTKLFHNLMNETGLDLLSPGSLAENGFAIDQPMAFAGTRGGGIYASIPLNDPEKAERFATGMAGAFTNSASVRMAATGQVRCILSRDRLHILAGEVVAGTNQTAWTNLEGRVRSSSSTLVAVISADNSLISGGMLPVYAQPGRSLITLTRESDRILAEVTGPSIALDPIAPLRSALPFALPFGWAQIGQGIAPYFAQTDLAGLSFIMNLRSLWDQTLRPFVLAQIKRSTRNLDNPLTRLLSGGKPLEERIIGMLDVENAILGNLTGRIGVVLRSLKNFSILSISPSRLQESLDGVLVFETPRAASAQAILKHLAGFSALPTGNQLEITQSDDSGVSIVTFSAPRFRMPDIHVAACGRYVLVGLSKPALSSLAAQGEVRGNVNTVFGANAANLLNTTAHDVSLSIAPTTLFASITGTLDEGSRRNLEPFAAQIRKARSLALIQFRTPTGTRLLGQCILSATPEEQDPFEDTSHGSDPLLWILGSILIAVFAGPLVFMIVRRFRNR